MYVKRNVYDEELRELKQVLLQMGGLVEKALSRSIEALKDMDADVARNVIEGDLKINELEHSVEEKVLGLILRQQPVAKDLRRIMAALKIASDLERMADLSVDIAKVAVRLEGQKLLKPLVDIPRMGEITQRMVTQSLNSYIDENVKDATALARMDDDVDALYNAIIRELINLMVEKPEFINQALQLSFVGRYIERIADHATNIAESVVYLVEGKRPELN
jgi:phosphate transport system protein